MYVFELVGEDDRFASYEASTMAGGLRRVAPGVALAESLSPHVEQLAYTHRINTFRARTDASVPAVRRALEEDRLDPTGSAAVRARSIRGAAVDTQSAERSLGSVLVEAGFEINLESPRHELRVIFTGGQAFLGWLHTEMTGDFANRRPTERPFFQPGSLSPRLARALVNIAGAKPGVRLLDPMCGTGGIVLEASLVGARATGMDVQPRMVRGTRDNCATYTPSAPFEVGLGDARRLPVRAKRVDTIVFDVPYGRQSPVASGSSEELISAAVREAYRVADRAVVVADRPLESIVSAEGWILRSRLSRRVHRSLTRHVHDLRAAD